MIFASRRRHGPDRYLPWKTVALVGAAVLILLADRFAVRWPVWIAIGLLLVAFVLRFLPRRGAEERPPDDT